MGGFARAQGSQRFQGLRRHGGVAQGDVLGDFLVACKGGVLHQVSAMLLGVGGGGGYGAVIVQVGDGHFRVADGADGFHAAVHRSGGHEDHRVTAQTMGGPGHALAVVAIGGGDGQAHIAVGEELVDGVGSAQGFEGVEAKALGLILDVDPLHPQLLGQVGQRHQRGGLVPGQGAVEGSHVGEGLWVAAVRQGLPAGVGVDDQFQ